MATMRAAFCTAREQLEVREVPEPIPGPGEVVVRVRSCGICGSDLHFFHGALPPPAVCPGHEISGEVYEVGQGVDLHPGDRVAVEPLVVCRECVYCRTGDYQLCRRFQLLGAMVDGGFADYVRVPGYAVFPLPATVDCEVGALTEPLAVTVHAVRLAPVRLGQRVLVLGAGTIGLLAVATARAAGATDVWITARHPQQRAAATALGASRVFTDPADGGTLAAAAHEHPVDVVIETVGGTADTLTDAVQYVRPGGTVTVLGVFSTMPTVNALSLLMKEIRVVGSLTYGRPDPQADFEIALQLLAADPERYRPIITHRVPLDDIRRGFALAGDKRAGSIKVAVTPG